MANPDNFTDFHHITDSFIFITLCCDGFNDVELIPAKEVELDVAVSDHDS